LIWSRLVFNKFIVTKDKKIQLEKAIQEKEHSRNKDLPNTSSDLSGNIGANNRPKSVLNNKVDLENDFDTLDEPIIDTIVCFFV
jgi:hypothetical protein